MEEGAEGLMKERRGKACAASSTRKRMPPKLDLKVEENLIAENQRLRMEIEDFIQSLDDYIYYYNNERISLKLKGMSPAQYQTHSLASNIKFCLIFEVHFKLLIPTPHLFVNMLFLFHSHSPFVKLENELLNNYNLLG